jgi:hypothetical protein
MQFVFCPKPDQCVIEIKKCRFLFFLVFKVQRIKNALNLNLKKFKNTTTSDLKVIRTSGNTT